MREVKPAYTAEAMRAKVQGTVLLDCVVMPDGTVGRVQVVRSLDSSSTSASGKVATGWARSMLFVISIVVNIGMWLERYVIVVTSLHRDFVPAAWGYYHGTFWDYATYYGTIGLFFTLLFIFIRVLPVISITEKFSPCMSSSGEAKRRRKRP